MADGASDTTRIEWCRVCGRDRGWEYGNDGRWWQECSACDGKGETEVECELIEMEDLPCE